ncbi:hypothetical protein [Mesorhizobium sp. B2-6-1]|uniref:hypothetical protein n=1 Tax=Mesorhizobium sp. B2-6-1 TaxID=2589916 RepID=UPI001FEF7B95|nr:hypothetical protein [Mesorhizobium sp. B2-6-1]
MMRTDTQLFDERLVAFRELFSSVLKRNHIAAFPVHTDQASPLGNFNNITVLLARGIAQADSLQPLTVEWVIVDTRGTHRRVERRPVSPSEAESIKIDLVIGPVETVKHSVAYIGPSNGESVCVNAGIDELAERKRDALQARVEIGTVDAALDKESTFKRTFVKAHALQGSSREFGVREFDILEVDVAHANQLARLCISKGRLLGPPLDKEVDELQWTVAGLGARVEVSEGLAGQVNSIQRLPSIPKVLKGGCLASVASTGSKQPIPSSLNPFLSTINVIVPNLPSRTADDDEAENAGQDCDQPYDRTSFDKGDHPSALGFEQRPHRGCLGRSLSFCRRVSHELRLASSILLSMAQGSGVEANFVKWKRAEVTA